VQHNPSPYYCTPDLFTWFSETGCFAAQTVWRKDNTIKDGVTTCLAALVCTPCYLAYLLDNKEGKKAAPPPSRQPAGHDSVLVQKKR
jgi:hypothetical protein